MASPIANTDTWEFLARSGNMASRPSGMFYGLTGVLSVENLEGVISACLAA